MSEKIWGYLESGKLVHLALLPNGPRKPIIHWHGGHSGCPSHCDDHHYRNFDEFIDFVTNDLDEVHTEFDGEVDPEFAIEKIRDRQKAADRSSGTVQDAREYVKIDGWDFLGGYWT